MGQNEGAIPVVVRKVGRSCAPPIVEGESLVRTIPKVTGVNGVDGAFPLGAARPDVVYLLLCEAHRLKDMTGWSAPNSSHSADVYRNVLIASSMMRYLVIPQYHLFNPSNSICVNCMLSFMHGIWSNAR